MTSPAAKQSCRTCVFWDVPHSRRRSMEHAPCIAPFKVPDGFPESIALTIRCNKGFPMEPNEGTDCPAWKALQQ